MSQLSPQMNPRPEQRQWLRRLGEVAAAVGAALAGVYLLTQVSEVTTMEHCDTCTTYVTGNQGGNLRLRDGDVLCITATGHFDGNLNLQGRRDTIRIVNEGVLSPNNLNFNQGAYVVENHGVFDVNPINYNNADYARVVNHAGGQFEVQTLNLRNQGIFENAGTFNAHTFNQSGASRFVNDSTGMVFIRQLQVNGGSTVHNDGTWDISQQGLTLNSGSEWHNHGTLTVARDLTINSNSQLANTGQIDLGRDFVINQGEVDNQQRIEAARDFTLNGGGTMDHLGHLSVGRNFTVGGTLRGADPAGQAYGTISVVGRSTVYGSATLADNLDICDQGTPPGGLDQNYGSPGPQVTYCVHTAGGANNLPVELVGFGAQAQPDGRVALWWETASELNNHYFQVERSQGDRQFEAVGRIEGAGTSAQSHRYQFDDRPARSGTFYYRLQQVDFDGSTHYSSLVEVSLAPAAPAARLRLYPNPAQAHTTLGLHLTQAMPIVVQVSTSSGLVVQRSQHAHRGGQQEIRLDLGELTSGIYLVQVLSSDGTPLASPQKLIRQ